MSKPTVVTMPGDGIGKTVLPAAIKVLEKANNQVGYVAVSYARLCFY